MLVCAIISLCVIARVVPQANQYLYGFCLFCGEFRRSCILGVGAIRDVLLGLHDLNKSVLQGNLSETHGERKIQLRISSFYRLIACINQGRRKPNSASGRLTAPEKGLELMSVRTSRLRITRKLWYE